jgi:hypothetical protein
MRHEEVLDIVSNIFNKESKALIQLIDEEILRIFKTKTFKVEKNLDSCFLIEKEFQIKDSYVVFLVNRLTVMVNIDEVTDGQVTKCFSVPVSYLFDYVHMYAEII